MNPAAWQSLWTAVLYGGLGLFAVVSVYVAIAGFWDIRRMFSALAAEARESGETSGSDPTD